MPDGVFNYILAAYNISNIMALLTLLVDDDKLSLHLTRGIMQRHHLSSHFETASNGKEALLYLQHVIAQKKQLPDMIVLDLNMEGGNGWEFLEEYKAIIHQINKPIPIFVLSSFLYNVEYARIKENKLVRAFFSKPLVKSDIAEIQDILAKPKVIIDLS